MMHTILTRKDEWRDRTFEVIVFLSENETRSLADIKIVITDTFKNKDYFDDLSFRSKRREDDLLFLTYKNLIYACIEGIAEELRIQMNHSGLFHRKFIEELGKIRFLYNRVSWFL